MAQGLRHQRIADLLLRDLAKIISRDLSDPRLEEMSIVDVTVSEDCRNANVFYIIHDDSKLPEVKKALEKATGFLRTKVANKAELRYTPKLHFIYDESIRRGADMQSILSQLPSTDDTQEN